MIKELINLPLYIQIMVASGYVGYIAAKHGYRENERKDELLYGIFVYGFFGWVTFDALTSLWEVPVTLSGLFAMLASLFVGLVWRWKGQGLYFKLLYWLRVSNENGIDTVWNRLQQDTNICPTQVIVTLKDETQLMCDDVQGFVDAPVPLYETDVFGSISLYVTHHRKLGWDDYREVEGVRDDVWGCFITYIPHQEIKKVKFRYCK